MNSGASGLSEVPTKGGVTPSDDREGCDSVFGSAGMLAKVLFRDLPRTTTGTGTMDLG